MASRVQRRPARPRRGRHMRLRLRYHRLHGQRRDWGRRGAGAVSRTTRATRYQADAGFRAEPYRARSSLGEVQPGLLCAGQRGTDWRRAAKLHAGRDRSGAANPGARTRPQLSRLARHAATQLRQSSAAEVANRRIDRHRRQMRRRSLRHGDAGSARSFPAHLGRRPGALLAEGDGGGAPRASGLHLHGGGLLGPRMDAAAAGLRLLLRQEAL